MSRSPTGVVEAVEHADVLVVEVDVDVAVEVAVVAEELLARRRVRVGERVEDLADGRAVGGDLALAADGRAQDGWDADRGHGGGPALARRRRRTPRSPGRRPSPRRRSSSGSREQIGHSGSRRTFSSVVVALERVVHQQAADERLAGADDELDDLGRLQQAHRARQDAEDAVGAAGRRELGRRRLTGNRQR